MKKLLLSALALSLAFLSQAQITKGTTFIGGGFQINRFNSTGGDSSVSNQNPYSSGYSIAPTVGWAIKNDLVFGVTLGYGHGKTDYKSSNSPVNISNNYLGSLFLKKYKPMGKGFSLFGQGSLGINWSKTSSNLVPQYSSSQTSWGPSLTLFAGPAYRAGRHWQAEAALPGLAVINYSHSSYVQKAQNSPDQHSNSNGFSVSTAFSNFSQFTFSILYII
ncbi:hypothetical protein ACQ86N_47625 [Puia sp. P3]|uniref:hypothetical protein n=1 Tax=Puia sp. P3 TaxID=3423952 RepID=UPI003D664EC5